MENRRQEYLDRLESLVREEYLQKILELETKIDLIITKLDKVEKGTNNMNEHINFINNTYQKVKTPLFWVCDRVNILRGIKSQPQPQPVISNIEDQD